LEEEEQLVLWSLTEAGRRRLLRACRKVAGSLLERAESKAVFFGPIKRDSSFATITLEGDGPRVVVHSLDDRRTAILAKQGLMTALGQASCSILDVGDDLLLLEEAGTMWPSELLESIKAEIVAELSDAP
jgi:hypothetical protein